MPISYPNRSASLSESDPNSLKKRKNKTTYTEYQTVLLRHLSYYCGDFDCGSRANHNRSTVLTVPIEERPTPSDLSLVFFFLCLCLCLRSAVSVSLSLVPLSLHRHCRQWRFQTEPIPSSVSKRQHCLLSSLSIVCLTANISASVSVSLSIYMECESRGFITSPSVSLCLCLCSFLSLSLLRVISAVAHIANEKQFVVCRAVTRLALHKKRRRNALSTRFVLYPFPSLLLSLFLLR